MLKRKLARRLDNSKLCKNYNDDQLKDQNHGNKNDKLEAISYFEKATWETFYEFECELNERLKFVKVPPIITHIYNPVEYAANLHCDYLKKYLNGSNVLMFVGMNPGPNGMGQTGVPFGNVLTVRDVMQISGEVLQPTNVHPKRSIDGLKCSIEEPSGVKLWNLFMKLSGDSLETFAKNCYVHNFCPLAFFDKNGKNITPNELKGEYKKQIRDLCLRTLDKQIELLKPEVLVAVGDYVFTAIKNSVHFNRIRMLRLPHPSPRALNNHNWPEKAEQYMIDNDLMKYIRNEI